MDGEIIQRIYFCDILFSKKKSLFATNLFFYIIKAKREQRNHTIIEKYMAAANFPKKHIPKSLLKQINTTFLLHSKRRIFFEITLEIYNRKW